MAVPNSTFTVTLDPAHMFLESLESMQAMHSWAVMVVYTNGRIKVVTMNQDSTVFGALRMKASAIESSAPERCAITVSLLPWIQRLRAAVDRQMEASFRIYKNDDSPNIFCVVGDDSSPIDLGKALFRFIPSVPDVQIQSDAVAVHMKTECLREVLFTFGPLSSFVSITFKNDSITWSVASLEQIYESQTGDYYVQSPGPIRSSVMLLKWQGSSIEALRRASRMTDMFVLSPLPYPNWSFNAFRFLVKEGSHFTVTMRRRDFMEV